MMKKRIYQLYLADIRPLMDEEKQLFLYERLPSERQKKADACRLPRAKAASVAAGFLMEYALKQQELLAYQVRYAKSGQPVVTAKHSDSDQTVITAGKPKDGTEQPPVFLSVSHSGDYAVCAVCSEPIGVDLQQRKPIKSGMLRHFFTPKNRQEFLLRYGQAQENGFLNVQAEEAFLWQWAAKESYMKLTGEGMQLGFDRLAVREAEERIEDLADRYAPAVIKNYRILPGYCLSVCTYEDPYEDTGEKI